MKSITRGAVALWTAMAMGTLAAPIASAEQVGYMQAMCQIGQSQAQLNVKYTVYQDAAVWVDQHGLPQNTSEIGKIVYWEGQLNTVYGNYIIEGRNGIIEAFPRNGRYTDMIMLYVEQTSQTTFFFRDEQNVRHPCRVVSS